MHDEPVESNWAWMRWTQMRPVRVRHAWDDFPDCNLVNGEGLPCGPFEFGLE